MQPDQAFFLTQTELRVLQHEHGLTLQILQALPAANGDYRPEPCAKSALELASHIVSTEDWFLSGIAAGAFTSGSTPPDSVKTVTDVANWYVETFSANLALLKALAPGQCAQSLDFCGLFQMPAAAFLSLAMRHSIHHRGQLSTYLRPMGAKVPSIYGESYDAAEARKAAQAG